MWKDVLLVAAGGAVGAVLRFAASSWIPRTNFPWATLLVNLLGAFVLGAVFLEHGMDNPHRLWFAVGLLGSFTTLSTFSLETVQLLRESRAGLAVANMLANGIGGPLLALAGWRLRMAL